VIRALVAAAWLAFAPPKAMTVTEWADAHRVLSSESSAEPGQWRTARVPYLRPIMDAITDPDVDLLALECGSQCGKSEVILNAIGRAIDIAPGPLLLVQPTLDDARKFSRHRITGMLRDTPALRGKVRTSRVKDASASTLLKTFAGGHVTLAGANSPSGLASTPIRDLFGDEIDRWPREAGDEGDPWDIADKRTTTFWNRTRVAASSPTDEGASKIHKLFLSGDQRRFFVPCPHCDTRFVLCWQKPVSGVVCGFVKWPEGRPEAAYVECPGCARPIAHSAKPWMLARAEDRPTRPEQDGPPAPRTRSFHVSALYSPWISWGALAVEFLTATRDGREALKVFVNTRLAEVWKEPTGQIAPNVLLERRERYEPEVPAGACCLTLGVDVQDSWLEWRIDAWGPGEECWLAIDLNRIPGDPSRPEPWKELEQVLRRTYRHACGAELPVLATCVDTAGHRTNYAYDFVRRHAERRVYATIGRAGVWPWGLVSPPSPKRSGDNPRPVELYTIAVDTAKSLLASGLRETQPGPGFIHLPRRVDVAEEFCAQLVSERAVTRMERGLAVTRWEKTRPRNEQLDLWSLSIAALRLLRPRFEDMARVLAEYQLPAAAQPSALAPTPAPARPGSQIIRSRYLAGG